MDRGVMPPSLPTFGSGYTGFTVRLDNITGLVYDDKQSNVIALRTDATFGSGHWYEGEMRSARARDDACAPRPKP